MQAAVAAARYSNQPAAGTGLWTATEDPAGSGRTRYVDSPARYFRMDGCSLWRLHPKGAARVLVIDSPADLAAIITRFPFGPEQDEINFPALVAAGFAGLHATASGITDCHEALFSWGIPSTVWFRWTFESTPEECPLPEAVLRVGSGDRFIDIRDHPDANGPEIVGHNLPQDGDQLPEDLASAAMLNWLLIHDFRQGGDTEQG